MTSHQIENTSNKIGIIKKNQIEIPESKSAITEMKSALKESTSRSEQAKERIILI